MLASNPIYPISDWSMALKKKELLKYKPKAKSRKGLMFQYYSDMIDCIKKTHQKVENRK